MARTRGDRLWVGLVVVLVACIVAGGALLAARNHSPAEIILSNTATPGSPVYSEVLVDGAVVSPALYPLRPDDSIASLLSAAGGLSTDAGSVQLRLYIPHESEVGAPQRVNINIAPSWMLQALPGIGETRAQAIIAYREQNGPFRSTSEITRVAGIGPAIYDSIKDKITVG